METSKSIIGRQVLCIDDRKIMGRIEELRIDCDTQKVSYLLTKSLAVPFESIIGIGDTLITVQSSKELVTSGECRTIAMKGFKLLDTMVYTRMGNILSPVSSYSFDEVTGEVLDMTLKDERVFARNTFIFFDPELCLIDPDKQSQAAGEGEGAAEGEQAAEVVFDAEEEDAELMKELIGQVTVSKVATEDESFVIEKDSVLTAEQIQKAFELGILTDLSFAV